MAGQRWVLFPLEVPNNSDPVSHSPPTTHQTMRRLFAVPIALILLAAGVIAWALPRSGGDLPPPVPDGDREVAWIQAATSGASWERFVAGVHRARHDWPQLWVDDSRAFLDQTTAVPEVVLGVDGAPARLHIRWYKLTSANNNAFWVNRLAARESPPLAFIGGGTSDRAAALARALADEQSVWHGTAPLLLLTTATANGVGDANSTGPDQKSLMELYPGRSFRFCFTNEQMAKAVVDFLWSQPNLRPTGYPIPDLAAVGLGATDPFAAAALLDAQAEANPPIAYALSWEDDPYSSDLANQFHAAFHQPHLPRVLLKDRIGIPFSVGDVYRPNAWEAQAADRLLQELRAAPLERRVLVLPAGAAQARRVLRAMTGAMPFVGRNVVAVSGDSISLNTVYRDADIAWNVRAVPIPVVFFAHQNPVAWDVDPDQKPLAGAKADDPGVLVPPTATDDVLLHAFLVRLLVESAYQIDQPAGPALTDSADVLAERLRGHRPVVFDAAGNRGGGEYVVALLPQIEPVHGGAEVQSSAILEVWSREGTVRSEEQGSEEKKTTPHSSLLTPHSSAWRRIKSLVTDHARRLESAP